MAVAKLVCGACGAGVSASDSVCPSCGETIERDAQVTSERRCAVCGFINTSDAEYCQSCGARLGSGRVDAPPPMRQAKPQQQKKQQKHASSKEPSRRKIEPWTIIAIVAIVGLIAFFVYEEVVKPGTPSTVTSENTSAGPAPQMPQQVLPDLRPLQAAVDQNPGDPAAILRLANGLHDNGLYERAIDMYRKYLSRNPKDPDARVDMGICYYQRALVDSVNAAELFDTSVKEMTTAVTQKPTHQPAAFNLGIVYLHMGNLDDSNKWLKRAVEINKGSDLGVRAQQILDQHMTAK